MTNNKEATRYFSDIHESSVARALGGTKVANSGAGKFSGGDVIQKDASLLIECKTVMTEKQSVSVKKDWLVKNKEEAFSKRLDNNCLCINFGPGTPNYYVIDEKLMKFLVEKLEEYNE